MGKLEKLLFFIYTMYELLVILLVVILALILWQVVRIYFDHKSGGVDFSKVKALGQQTFASGLKVFSSGKKLIQAETPEARKKYLEKLGQRTSTAAESALSTAEAGKQAVQSEGWFSGLTGLFAGESKGRTALLNKCKDVEKAIQNGKFPKEETGAALDNIFNGMGIYDANTCELAKQAVRKMKDEKLIATASAAMDDLLKFGPNIRRKPSAPPLEPADYPAPNISQPVTPPAVPQPVPAPRPALPALPQPVPAPRTNVDTHVENILGFCSTLNNMQQRFDTNDQTELKEIFGRVKYEYNNQIDCDVLRTVLQRTSLNTLQDFDSRIQEFTKKVYEKIQSSNIQNPPLPALPKPVPAPRSLSPQQKMDIDLIDNICRDLITTKNLARLKEQYNIGNTINTLIDRYKIDTNELKEGDAGLVHNCNVIAKKIREA